MMLDNEKFRDALFAIRDILWFEMWAPLVDTSSFRNDFQK